MSLDQGSVAAALPAYEIGEELGRGHWGVVFGARHRQLGRDVAVKQLPGAYADQPEVVQRFVNEAKVLGSLNHRHIVPVYDFVQHEGLCLLVMERLHGGTLTTRFRGGASPEDVCAIALAAASALHYAHQHGVLHRDVKPENIMFSGEGVLKVTDFGIAKVVGGSETVLTRTGFVLGTPAYMAPEQAKGEPLTPATDLYALGLIVYELLAGKLPFEAGEDPLSLIYRHVYEAPLPLLDAAPGVPPELAGVIMRALERDPAGRFETAEAFGVALASSAKEAWGGRWLSRSDITVGAPGPILAAAHGDRSPGTVASPGAARLQMGPVGAGPAPPPAPPAEPAGEPDGGGWRWRPPVIAALAAAAIAVGLVVVLGAGDDEAPTRAANTPSGSAVPASTTAPTLAAGDAWRSLRDIPAARQQVAAAEVAGTVWVAGGLAGEDVSDRVDGYDPAIDTWKAGPPLPIPLHHATAVAYDDELVVIGGWSPRDGDLSAVTSDRVLVLRDGKWADLPPLTHPRAAGAAAVVGDKIVVTGGQADGELVAETEVFDGKQWSDAAELPTPREHLAATADGRYAYVVGGRELAADKNSARLERYDPAADRWERLPDMPTARGGLGAAVVGGQIVAVGGESTTGVYDDVEAYDVAKREWSELPKLPAGRHGLAVVAIGPVLYALAGADQPSHATAVATASLLRFGRASGGAGGGGAWRALRAVPTARQQVATAVVSGTIWVAGGLNGEEVSRKVEGYDAAINTWKEGPPLPVALHHATAVSYEDELVVIGGWSPRDGDLSAVTSDRVYVLRDSKWTRLPSLKRPRTAAAAAVVGDKLVVAGGQADGKLVPTTEVFDGKRWTEAAAMPTPREHLAAAADDKYAYFVGGRNLSADQNSSAVERYDPAADRWEKLPGMPTRRGGLAVGYADGKLIAVGGERNTSVHGAVEIYDVAGQTWVKAARLGTPRHGLGAAAIGRNVYALAGATKPTHATATDTAEVFQLPR